MPAKDIFHKGRSMELPYKVLVVTIWSINLKSAVNVALEKNALHNFSCVGLLLNLLNSEYGA
ncbi:hypothetical protein [Okeania sp. SIO2G5]|uniref:hypothetical protein n=1 Tax=Okeania sp. SIO2G5 TaxID=2607796 RepID=UPI0013C02585|nr:hypothetical protein [Okeania sp. SIO2G5]NEP71352.1 hypothetical protein [Okeania sp. SIO2G5]